jgi:hypothetical protein
MDVSWLETGKTIHLRFEGKSKAFSVGQFVTFETHPLGARIESFVGQDKSGPFGLTYLPWRGDRWGTPVLNRRVIIFPTELGATHNGTHLEHWDQFQLLNDGVCPE